MRQYAIWELPNDGGASERAAQQGAALELDEDEDDLFQVSEEEYDEA